MMRGTLAVQIFLGVMALYLVQVIVTALDMRMMSSIFSILGGVAVLAVIILVQPERRRLLLVIGQNALVRRLMSQSSNEELSDEVTKAATATSRPHSAQRT